MNIRVGIVGLPNVGKSTLFNALLKKQSSFAKAMENKQAVGGIARVGNYAFTTIEPNVGVVPVPDERLIQLAEITKIEHNMSSIPPIKPATVEFVDIAGLVRGASEGAGLGNKFLSHIREVQIIAHVVRAFEDADVIREGSVDVLSDYKTIETELILSDLQTLEKVNEKALRSDPTKKNGVEKLRRELNEGRPAKMVSLTDEERIATADLFLLSNKKEIIVLNVSENEYNDEKNKQTVRKYSETLGIPDDQITVVCAKVESELSDLSEEEGREYLKELGVEKSGLERLIQKAYEKLGLISFLTCGEIEVRAWTIKKGSTAPVAAGVIHTDFTKNFIKAEVVSFEAFVKFGGWKNCKEKGKARFEGRDYVVNEGDIIEFKIGR